MSSVMDVNSIYGVIGGTENGNHNIRINMSVVCMSEVGAFGKNMSVHTRSSML